MITIKHAAVKRIDGNGFIVGKSHADCHVNALKNKTDISKSAQDQGFCTSDYKFVDRVQAAIIAVKAKQVDDRTIILFSEDLWLYNGFSYDKTGGYFK